VVEEKAASGHHHGLGEGVGIVVGTGDGGEAHGGNLVWEDGG
jgi:hypothetical protein